ncbi:Mechanosensitive ion channel family protein [Sporosarcina sp. ANT_H38]|uniref:mechanosensitive ion channel family protein n=1 Tax=Sporosarcina sp. ANT_H38 TaxID=2597358 RepID=UPI0021055D85|nr:mechanosensitive ion channel family protein [Sporosarcina sp. ANT_H38]
MDISKDFKEVGEILFSQKVWISTGTLALRIVFIVLLAVIVVNVGKVIISHMFKVKLKGPLRHSKRREKTLVKLLQNTLSYVVYFSAILAVLSEFSIDVKGLLAGAGVLGLAVGFGAQSLVKDVITGFFIIFEDQFSVGDYVKIGIVEGTVEEIGLRTTKLKSFTGEVSILPNGTIIQVTNYSMENSLAIVDVAIPFEVGVDKAEKIIEKYLSTLLVSSDDFTKTPKLIGAQDFTETEMIVRIIAETKPLRHFDAARTISVGLKKYLEQQGIEIPYPTLVTKSFSAN